MINTEIRAGTSTLHFKDGWRRAPRRHETTSLASPVGCGCPAATYLLLLVTGALLSPSPPPRRTARSHRIGDGDEGRDEAALRASAGAALRGHPLPGRILQRRTRRRRRVRKRWRRRRVGKRSLRLRPPVPRRGRCGRRRRRRREDGRRGVSRPPRRRSGWRGRAWRVEGGRSRRRPHRRGARLVLIVARVGGAIQVRRGLVVLAV